MGSHTMAYGTICIDLSACGCIIVQVPVASYTGYHIVSALQRLANYSNHCFCMCASCVKHVIMIDHSAYPLQKLYPYHYYTY